MPPQTSKLLIGAVVAAALAFAVYYGLISQQTANSIQTQANQTLQTGPASQQTGVGTQKSADAKLVADWYRRADRRADAPSIALGLTRLADSTSARRYLSVDPASRSARGRIGMRDTGTAREPEPRFLARRPANHVALTPLSFLRRAALAHPDRVATIYRERRTSWAETERRARRLASALVGLGVERGDTVAMMAANTPELYEAHFGVPMAGAILNALNIRLDADTIAYVLEHSGAKVLITDREFAATVKPAVAKLGRALSVIDIDDEGIPGESLGSMDYEALLAGGDPVFSVIDPADEWDAISLNYTSGTTGRPKGVLYHHRGAYLNALGNILEWHMGERPVYLWTLPMFHCNGWCFPWTLAAKAGTNVCLRKVAAKPIYDALADHGVDHLCGAPIVLKFMLDAKPDERRPFEGRCKVMTAGAPPPSRRAPADGGERLRRHRTPMV